MSKDASYIRPETVQLEAGQTPMGTLTVATHTPRKKIRARLVREGDWRALLAVIDAADGDLGDEFWEQTETHHALKRLRRLIQSRKRTAK
jgi:hypothetical protein